MKKLLALSCICLLGPACSGDAPIESFNPTTSLRLESDGAGRVCSDAGECFDDPCGCDALGVEIDDATGESRETCYLADGTTDAACGDVVACVTVTLPEPDCHLCAIVGGAILYSSCVVEDELYCEYYDFGFTGGGTGSGGGGDMPPPDGSDPTRPPEGEPTDPGEPMPPCAAGSTFPSDDGCNHCECLDDGSVVCTERACNGCLPGETFTADDGCNVCTCDDRGNISCTEMRCGGSCRICTDARGNVVIDECRNDCSDVMCPMVACAPGYEARRLDGECCETCVPVDDCSLVRCSDPALVECPAGWSMVRVPGSCCDYRCEPNTCDGVACPAVDLDCPDGSRVVSGQNPDDCCQHCEPDPTCYSDADCRGDEICSVSLGDCQSPCAAGDEACIAVCMGVCLPGECPLDFVCEDGSLPQGADCRCPSNECPLDFVCPNGTLPQGSECRCDDTCADPTTGTEPFICPDGTTPQGWDCRCGDECLLDFICQDGSQPQGAECRCPDECPLDFVCADGTNPQGADCWCSDECLLDFVCPNGTNPQGAECRCSDDPCTSDSDCASDAYCTVTDGVCNAPPGCDTTGGAGTTCPAVCTGTCQAR